jgi:hypothetical protein
MYGNEEIIIIENNAPTMGQPMYYNNGGNGYNNGGNGYNMGYNNNVYNQGYNTGFNQGYNN